MDELLHKSRRSLAAAERLLGDGDYDFAVSRAYYAMFYAAQALLLTRDIRRSKHSGIIAAFNEQFVREGKVPHQLFISLRDAFDDRAEGDYGLVVISEEQACAGIAAAREFVEEVSQVIAGTPAE
jgi:uncharacterized protein (UPF0332 family)